MPSADAAWRCQPWWIIDPRESRPMTIWDGVTSLALLFTAIFTPYEVGFLQAPECACVTSCLVYKRTGGPIAWTEGRAVWNGPQTRPRHFLDTP